MSNRQRIEEFKEACNNWSELCVQLSREVRALNNRVWELEQSKLRTQVYFWCTVIIIGAGLFAGWLKGV